MISRPVLHLLMTISAFLVSTTFIVGAAITRGLDPALLTLFRFLLAASIMGPMVHNRCGLRVSWQAIFRYGCISLSLVIFFWCMFLSLRYTSAFNNSVLFTLVPLISSLYAFVLIGERLGRGKFMALGCGLLGAVWVISQGDPTRILHLSWNRGDAIFLAGCLAMGLYTPLVHLLHRGEPMLRMTFWVLVTGCCWLLLFTAPSLMQLSFAAVSLHVWIGIAYLAVFTTIITFFLTQFVTLRLGSTVVMSYSYLYPPFVLVIELALGRGLPDPKIWPGILLISVAMLILFRAGSRQQDV